MTEQPTSDRAKRIAEAVAGYFIGMMERQEADVAEIISTSGLAELEAERDGYKTMVCSQSCKMHYPPPDGEPLPWAELEARLVAAERERDDVIANACQLLRERDEARANLKDAALLIKKLCQPHTVVLECEAIDWVRRKSGFDPLRLATDTEGGKDA